MRKEQGRPSLSVIPCYLLPMGRPHRKRNIALDLHCPTELSTVMETSYPQLYCPIQEPPATCGY